MTLFEALKFNREPLEIIARLGGSLMIFVI